MHKAKSKKTYFAKAYVVELKWVALRHYLNPTEHLWIQNDLSNVFLDKQVHIQADTTLAIPEV